MEYMTEKALDKCPKCSSEVTNQVECPSCGIVFQKYFQAESRKKALAEQAVTVSAPSGNRPVFLIIGLVIGLVLASAGYFLTRSNDSQAPAGPGKQATTAKDKAPLVFPMPSVTVSNTGAIEGKTLDEEFIHKAVKATVSVRTSWGGNGSGFFISEHGVVTNKHVVQFEEAAFEEAKIRIERSRKILDLEVVKISELKKKMEQMPEGPSRTQLDLIIQSREAEVNKYLVLQKNEEEKLAKMKEQKYSLDIKIVTDDGKEYPVSSVITSPSHDLALLKVYAVSGQYLMRRPDGLNPVQGQSVYTVGSPLGLTNTVTSGIFSAFRKMPETGETYLQTDAAINPGNSGGPLIDNQGHVLGVNTMIMSQAEGIGFAIPIDKVFEEFSSSL
jgi:serine protease Do